MALRGKSQTGTSGPFVLIIDEDPAVRLLLRRVLGSAGYRTHDVDPAEFDQGCLANRLFDLAIVDLDATAWGEAEPISSVRGATPMPVLALSVRSDEDTAATALDSGADDLVRKPFGTKELLARVANAMRRRARELGKTLRVVSGELEIDLLHRRTRICDREVRLSAKPYEMLRKLAEEAGKVVTHQDLLQTVWGPERVDRIAYLRVAIRELRRKLEPDPKRPCYILTESRVGYRLHVPEPSRRAGSRNQRPGTRDDR